MANVIFLRKGNRHTYPNPQINFTVGKVNSTQLKALNTAKVKQLFKQQEKNK